jgi:uncharacterized SAM-binding protein YcdF (DUF218 family)
MLGNSTTRPLLPIARRAIIAYTPAMIDPPGKSRRTRHGLFGLLLVICLLWIFAPQLANSYSRWLVVSDDLPHADTAIALAGGEGERLLAAIELYRQKTVDRILIVGPKSPILKVYTGEKGLSQGEAKRRIAVKKGVREEDALLELGATSTYEEAQSTVDRAVREGWTSVIVVTSPMHTRRSRATFRKLLEGTGIDVYMHHLELDRSSQDPEDWWNREGDTMAVFTETVKLGFYAKNYGIWPW